MPDANETVRHVFFIFPLEKSPFTPYITCRKID